MMCLQKGYVIDCEFLSMSYRGQIWNCVINLQIRKYILVIKKTTPPFATRYTRDSVSYISRVPLVF